MNSPQEILKRVELTISLLSILNAQLYKVKVEIETAINTQNLVGPNVGTLHSGVMTMLSRGGGRPEVDRIFLDWKEACGLGANGESKPPEANGNKTNGHRLESTGEGQDWLRMI